MGNKNIDKFIKQNLQQDTYIDERINQLFEDSKKEEYTSNKKLGFANYFKYATVTASLALALLTGGCTYAHINGIETIISPLLRNLGINSKYEENANSVNKSVVDEKVEVTLRDIAIDNGTLIVGYELEIENINLDNWLEIYGRYSIDGISIKPISTTIDKDNDGKFIYYQLFDTNEIDLKDKESIEFKADVVEIVEYIEYETLTESLPHYLAKHEGKWSFAETVPVKNLVECKEYEFEENEVEAIDDVYVKAEKYVESSYANIISITTDKTKHGGDSFEQYYKIYDEQNNEIAVGSETREYDHTIYTDRLAIKNLNKYSKIRIDIFIAPVNEEYRKVNSIYLDMRNVKEIKKEDKKVDVHEDVYETEDKKIDVYEDIYETEEYSFKYNKNWKIGKFDDVNPESAYYGALRIEIPSTTNMQYGSEISIKTDETNYSSKEYIEDLKEGYIKEYHVLENEGECKVGNENAYQITFSTTDGESDYISKIYLINIDNKIYKIGFFGTELEYNNIDNDLELFLESFEIK